MTKILFFLFCALSAATAFAADLQIIKPVKAEASSSLPDAKADLAIDGDINSSWKSLPTTGEEQWFKVDLGSERVISGIDISWDFAYAKEFSIEVSTDGGSWTQVLEQKYGKGGREALEFDPVPARYVKVHLIKRSKADNYSIGEVGVKGRL